MNANPQRYESGLTKAKGHGSAHHGVHHWWHQRLTAVASIPLMIWLVWAVVYRIAGASHAEFTAWLAAPHNAVLMILAVLAIFYHAALGTQVILEDYMGGAMKRWGLMKTAYYFVVAGVICVFMILKIALS
ncbi:MAG: succinate dehydrogenase, hydrophobic membrane anchor protein [Alphaproteobacteria bacterium]|nr:succinate dehydrogenase, hydrophobic membrane anchor protein [Alphaproteobacteria bacterium]